MGLLADIFSYGDTQKRRLRGLLDDPAGTLGLGARRAGEDQNALLSLMDASGYTPGSKSVLDTPQQNAIAQAALANKAMETYGGLLGSLSVRAPRPNKKAMEDMGFEDGWFRGGPQIVDGKKNGNWLTRVKDEAVDYASRLKNPDVREYAVPKDTLKFDMGYSNRLALDIADKVERMGDKGAAFAKLLRQHYQSGQITGTEAWRGLAKHLGDDDAITVLESLGFRGVQGLNSPNYLRVFPKTPIRDANLAKFDPARQSIDDIYGAASPAFMGLLATGVGGGLAVADRMKAREGKTPSRPSSP